MQGTHIRKVMPHAGLPGVFVFDPSYAHWIENTSEASRSSCDISATSLPWLGYLGLFLTDRCIWNPGAGWDADLLLPLLPSRDFRGVWQYGQDLIGNAEFNMLWLSSFHFYIYYVYVFFTYRYLSKMLTNKWWLTFWWTAVHLGVSENRGTPNHPKFDPWISYELKAIVLGIHHVRKPHETPI